MVFPNNICIRDRCEPRSISQHINVVPPIRRTLDVGGGMLVARCVAGFTAIITTWLPVTCSLIPIRGRIKLPEMKANHQRTLTWRLNPFAGFSRARFPFSFASPLVLLCASSSFVPLICQRNDVTNVRRVTRKIIRLDVFRDSLAICVQRRYYQLEELFLFFPLFFLSFFFFFFLAFRTQVLN